MKFGRRGMLAGSLATLGHPATAADMKGFPHDKRAPEPIVRLAQPAPGTAGAVWKPLIDSMPTSMTAGLSLQWLQGGPGLSQYELMVNQVNVACFGAMGVLQARAVGGDVAIFGPALLADGRWLVHGGSPFRRPKDLVGRRVACPFDTTEIFQQANLAAACAGLDIRKELVPVFGTLEQNQAAFERQDVEAVIAPEPMASQYAASGAHEIATVAGMWRDSTGDALPLFMVGLAAHRGWITADQARAKRVAQLIVDANTVVRSNPARLGSVRHIAGIYATAWDASAFASMDRQVAAAVRVGLVARAPAEKVYLTI